MDDLSSLLNTSRIGCHIDDVCINHVFYADHLCLMAPCAIALQELINGCYQYSNEIDLNKSFCVAFAPKHKLSLPSLYSMCSLAVSTLDSPAVEPRSNPGSGKILMSENLRLYATSPVNVLIDKVLSSD